MKTHIVKLTPGTITKEGDFYIQHNAPQAIFIGSMVKKDVYRSVPDAQLVRTHGTSFEPFGNPEKVSTKQGILVCNDIGENRWLSTRPEFLDASKDYWLPRVAGFNPNKAGRGALTYPNEYEGGTRENSKAESLNKSRDALIGEVNALIEKLSEEKPSKQKEDKEKPCNCILCTIDRGISKGG